MGTCNLVCAADHGAEPWGERLTSCKAAAETIAGHAEQCCGTDAVHISGRSGLTGSANHWKTHCVPYSSGKAAVPGEHCCL